MHTIFSPLSLARNTLFFLSIISPRLSHEGHCCPRKLRVPMGYNVFCCKRYVLSNIQLSTRSTVSFVKKTLSIIFQTFFLHERQCRKFKKCTFWLGGEALRPVLPTSATGPAPPIPSQTAYIYSEKSPKGGLEPWTSTLEGKSLTAAPWV